MLQSLREETEGKLQMLLSLGKKGLTSLFKEVRVFKVVVVFPEGAKKGFKHSSLNCQKWVSISLF